MTSVARYFLCTVIIIGLSVVGKVDAKVSLFQNEIITQKNDFVAVTNISGDTDNRA